MSDDSLIPKERPRYWRPLDRLLEGGGTALVVAVLWAAFGLAIVLVYGLRPNSLGRWLLFVFLAPLVWIVGEALVEGFHAIPFVKRARSSIDERTQNQSVSGTRIVYLLFEAIVLLTLFFTIIWVLGLVDP